MKNKILIIAVCCGAYALSGCLGTTDDSKMRTDYVTRASVEKLADDDINSQSIDMNRMKKEKKLGIGIRLTVTKLRPADARRHPLDSVDLIDPARRLASTYLQNVKAYQLYVIPEKTGKSQLMTGKDFDGVKFPFLIDMEIIFSTEVFERLDEDETMYKATINWKLIDNRTKASGGKLEAPVAKEARVCEAFTYRKTKVGSVSGRKMSGAEKNNIVNALFSQMGNCLIQFRAQLANRIPFGGKISSMRLRDGKLRFTLRAGANEGIEQKMQMLIINEEGDRIAVATVYPGSEGKSTLDVWRWLSPSLKKSILAVAGDKKKSEAWLEEEGNALYAVCLGALPPAKDEINQFSHR